MPHPALVLHESDLWYNHGDCETNARRPERGLYVPLVGLRCFCNAQA
jgi:hypothetical protein